MTRTRSAAQDHSKIVSFRYNIKAGRASEGSLEWNCTTTEQKAYVYMQFGLFNLLAFLRGLRTKGQFPPYSPIKQHGRVRWRHANVIV